MILPKEIIEKNIRLAENKTKMPIWKLTMLGILAGMFIGCGAEASNVAMHTIPNVGVARFVGGCVFPIGLMMIIFFAGELFTGNCLMIMSVIHKKVKVLQMIKVLCVVYFSNFVGAIIVTGFTYLSGQFNYSEGFLGAYTINVAMTKANLPFVSAFFSGILCNFFVCVAVLMGAAAKDVIGKVFAVFFPIMAFVVSGFEHCIANMYYIPAGLFAKTNPKYLDKAISTYGYTKEQIESLNWGNFITNNIIPVTLGNIIGGMVFVGLIIYFIDKKELDGTI